MIKSAAVALLTAAAALGAPAAHAGVHWSVGINLPVPVIGVPAYAPAPAYYAPSYYAPSYYAPAPVYAAPVYVAQRRVYYGPSYYPRAAYYRPAPVVYGYGYRGYHRGGWR